MAMRENERLIRFVEVAFGEAAPSTLGTLSKNDETRLQQLCAIADATRIRTWAAPEAVRRRAISLMPERPVHRYLASILGSSIGLAGARSLETLESFQVAYSLQEETMRVLYEREAEGWRILGRTGSADWQVECVSGVVPVDEEGSFEFLASDLSQTAIILSRGDVEITIPSATEVMEDGSPERD